MLAVDATGGSFAEALSAAYDAAGGEASAPPTPDAFLTRGEPNPDRMGLHVSGTGHTALKVVTSPRNRSLPAAPLIEAASEVFDLCVVACGDTGSAYAEDWLLAADRVVACSATDPDDALAARASPRSCATRTGRSSPSRGWALRWALRQAGR